MTPLSVLVPALLVLAGCAGERPGDVLIRSLEGGARAACEAFDDCTNACADGSEMNRRTWRCDG